MAIKIVNASDRPDLVVAAEALSASLWPNYLSTASSKAHWAKLYEAPLARFQMIAVDQTTAEVVALGNSTPFCWSESEDLPDQGWDWVLAEGVLGAARGERCNTLSALSVAIKPERRGEGLAITMLEAMKSTALAEGLSAMVAPVRPTRKHLYPLQDFATYCHWQRDDGTPIDPWLRTHVQMGATFLRPANCSMTVTGSIEQWTGWTGLRFPETGRYWLAGGLDVLRIDLASGSGIYEEPNYWMRHPL